MRISTRGLVGLLVLALVGFAAHLVASAPPAQPVQSATLSTYVDLDKAVQEQRTVIGMGRATLLNNGQIIVHSEEQDSPGGFRSSTAILQLKTARPTEDELYALIEWEGQFSLHWDKAGRINFNIAPNTNQFVEFADAELGPVSISGPSCSVECSGGSKCSIECPEGKAAQCYCAATTATCTCSAVPK